MQNVPHSVRNASLGRKSTQQKPLHAVGMQPIPFLPQRTQRITQSTQRGQNKRERKLP